MFGEEKVLPYIAPLKTVKEEMGQERVCTQQVCRYKNAHPIRQNEEAQFLSISLQADQGNLSSVKQAGGGRDIRSRDIRAAKGSGEWSFFTSIIQSILLMKSK